ncbi:MAG TPA: response regulator transcription factor [Candidatus Binatia bacterium]|nr:response regulator transcription factor [Candidatus Binatia bacterium]
MSSSVLNPEVIGVLVADSNQTQSQLLCGALRRQGAFKVANCRADLSECLSVLETDPADVLLIADGLTDDRDRLYELLRGVHASFPGLAIVLLLDNYDRELVVNSLRAGTRGLFCLASMPFKSLCRCITSVHQGQYWTNTEQMRYIIDALSIGPSVRLINSRGQVVLTPREEQTVNLVTEGLNNREIARELNLKENTVKKSLLRIYDKLGVSNRVELVLYALSHWQTRTSEPVQEGQPV